MKYVNGFLCFIFFFSFSQFGYSKIYVDKKTEISVAVDNVFDVVFLLERKGGKETKKARDEHKCGSILKKLKDIIKAQEAVVVSSALLTAAFILHEKGNEKIKQVLETIVNGDWFIYKTESSDFAILIPKKTYMQCIQENGFLQLDKLGLNTRFNDESKKNKNLVSHSAIPVSTFQKKLAGMKTNAYGAIIISAKHKDRMAHAATEIRAILRQKHKLRYKDDDDFTIFTQNEISEAADAASAVLNILLLIIASISLIVGGIGIMNIMLVTVTERTKEIGIRMAIGATTSAILTQFMIEAVVICLMGGLVGIACGVAISKAVGIALGWPIFISQKAVLISITSSVLIGLFFGYYPALKASRLNPVEALIDGR